MNEIIIRPEEEKGYCIVKEITKAAFASSKKGQKWNTKNRGVGSALTGYSIKRTKELGYGAIGLYRHEGFRLIGLDTCCCQNNDL